MNFFNYVYLAPVMLLLGCGAAASLSVAPEQSDSAEQFLNSGVWIAEDTLFQAQAFREPENMLMIDLSQSKDGSAQGAYLISIPDDLTVLKSSLQAFGEFTSITVRIIIQEGNDLSLLSQVELTPENAYATLEADLSAYRGREMTLILSATAFNASAQAPILFWNSPRLVHP